MNNQFFKWFRLIGIPLIVIFLSIPQFFIEPELMARFYNNSVGVARYYLEWRLLAYFFDMLLGLVQAVIISEFSIWLSERLDQTVSWERETSRRIYLQLSIHLAFSIIVSVLVNVGYYGAIGGEWISLSELLVCTMFGAVISITITSAYSGIYFFQSWKSNLLEAEKLKREAAEAEAQALRNQLDPHFLFNSLNTLAALVDENPQVAIEFIQRFSKVYRYVLDSREKPLVSLENELHFAKSYLYLLQARFGANLKVDFDISTDDLEKSLLPMSLQMLIENAVKHNVASHDKPLHLVIKSDGGRLIVENNIQRKSFVKDSTHIGLQNINRRYRLIDRSTAVTIEETPTHFTVTLPLLDFKSHSEPTFTASL
jgi:hypothetical protein